LGLKMPLKFDSYSGGELASLPYDSDATDRFGISLPIKGGKKHKLVLQFPPKITSDSKAANWQEDARYGFEEYAIWKGATARKINIELNYVMWGQWDQTKIKDEVRTIKQHLYVSGGSVGDKMPFIYITGWDIVEATAEACTWRLMDVSIEYSREMVGTGNDYWPLHTKVMMSCKLFTLTGSIAGKNKNKEPNYDSGKLPEEIQPGWY